MESHILGFISEFIVAIAILPYIVSIFRGTVKPNPISWFIWSVVGFTFWVVTPADADAMTKTLTLIFMLSPTTVFCVTLFRGENKLPDALEIFSLLVGLGAISLWYFAKESAGVMPTIIAIIADLCALLPTLRFVNAAPSEERPFTWMAFSFGSLLGVFAIETYSLQNVLLPAYMAFGSFLAAYPLVRYRLKKKISWREWIV